MIPISEVPDDINETDSNYYPMVLSREEYLLKFQTELSNLISNSNIGLESANKDMLKTGSRGAGINISLGAKSEVLVKNSNKTDFKVGFWSFD